MDATAPLAVTEQHRSLAIAHCLACGSVAEVTGSFRLPTHDGEESYVRTRCLDGHLVVTPAFAVAVD